MDQRDSNNGDRYQRALEHAGEMSGGERTPDGIGEGKGVALRF